MYADLNGLKDCFFAPLKSTEHYKIHEVKFELRTNQDKWDRNEFPCDELIVWIRGSDSIWFCADHCYIECESEVMEYVETVKEENEKKRVEKLLTAETIIV